MTDSPKKLVRVRFAPSPTGPLHIGGARTALFNWLFARHHSGKFIVRIEDTDIERSSVKYEKDILEALKWLGLEWDEGPEPQINADLNADKRGYVGDSGPYRQSERLDIYEKYLKRLLDENKAYWCFCAKEQLESDRQAMLAQGLAPKYSLRCRNFSIEESQKRINSGEPAVVRFKVPETEIEFNDIIRGKIKVDAALIGDIVIAKSLRSPLYNFSVVVDDYEMKITHVIRGEDHLSNTPKQILLQQVLNFDELKYAHLPLVLSLSRAKLSSRQMDTSVDNYRREGYLPEALINFLALLGWHPENDREILSREELVAEFDLKRVQKSGAAFNIEKLDWLNSQYIRKTDADKIIKVLSEFIPPHWSFDKNFLTKVIGLEKERMEKLTDFRDLASFFFELPSYDIGLLIWPRPTGAVETKDKEKILSVLNLLLERINAIFMVDFSRKKLEEEILPLTEVWGRGEVLWPLRSALSGRTASPGPFEIAEALGKDETVKRLKLAIEKLQ